MVEFGNKNFLVYSTLVLMLLSFEACGEPTDGCLDLIWELRNCSDKFHVPENCDDSTQSELRTCAEGVAEKLSAQCPDEITQKMINYAVASYKLSDQVICQNEMHAEITNKSECADVGKMAVVHLGNLIPGFLSDKGCRVFKTGFLLDALILDRSDCFKVIKDYIDIMYSKSPCSEIEVDDPTMDDALNLADVFTNIRMCWMLHRKVPPCNGTKSRRVQCVENETINKIKNVNMKTLENNILNVSELTDRVICENEQLRKDFDSNRGCLQMLHELGGYLIAEVNGYYTEEGCEGLNYREKYKLAVAEERCRPMMKTYWREMKKILPCFAGVNSAVSGEKVNFSIIFLVLTLSVTYLS